VNLRIARAVFFAGGSSVRANRKTLTDPHLASASILMAQGWRGDMANAKEQLNKFYFALVVIGAILIGAGSQSWAGCFGGFIGLLALAVFTKAIR
jgi:hypothetical protein